MFRIRDLSTGCLRGCGLALALLAPLRDAKASDVFYTFTGGADGGAENSGVVFRLKK